jgi:hypothetical protein
MDLLRGKHRGNGYAGIMRGSLRGSLPGSQGEPTTHEGEHIRGRRGAFIPPYGTNSAHAAL